MVVKANPRVTSLKGDALLTRVTGTQLEHAGTANDVLKQVPMVLGSDGNFEVFDVSGIRIGEAKSLQELNLATGIYIIVTPSGERKKIKQ